MSRTRVIALYASVALLGASGALVCGNVPGAGAAPPVAVPTCARPSPGHVACLARVLDRATGPSNASPDAATAPSGYSPHAISTAYAFPSGGGAGETIGIVDAYDDPTLTQDLATFSAQYGLPPCTGADGCLTTVNQDGGTTLPATVTAGWALETSLDVEWAHGLAPDAHLLLVESANTGTTSVFTAVRYAAQHAQYVNMSWGETEFATETSFDSTFTATPGVSFFAASGDTAAAVLYPSASPDVISVGGTVLTLTASTDSWAAETALTWAGGGCSQYERAAAAQAAYPSYDQTGADCAGARATPDVSFAATGASVYDTVGLATPTRGWANVGGTSVATVLMTARAALAGAHVDSTYVYGSNMRLYNVTTGSNGHPCEPGYNLCTGLGSWNTAVGAVNGPVGGTLSLTPASQDLTAGVVSGPMSVDLSTPAPSGGLSVSLSSTSGGISSSSGGPFSPSATVDVAAGRLASAPFYAETTVAGAVTIGAATGGWTPATETDTVRPGPLAHIVVSPGTANVPAGSTQQFNAAGSDAYGNPVAVTATWGLSAAAGSLTPPKGQSTVLTAGTAPANVTVSATSGSVTGSASVTITGPIPMSVSVSASTPTKAPHHSYSVPISTSATGPSGPVGGAAVTLRVYTGTCTGTPDVTDHATTGPSGTAGFTFTTSQAGSYCAEANVSAVGYVTGAGTLTFSITSPHGKRSRLTRLLAARLVG